MQLSPNTYCIKIQGVEMGRGELMCRYYLATKAGPVSEEIPGIATTEPAFGLPALGSLRTSENRQSGPAIQLWMHRRCWPPI